MNHNVDVCFVHFRTLNLLHLDAAWFSLSKQDFSLVNCVFFLDNNTPDSVESILEVLDRHPIPVPLYFCSDKHGNLNRTQSWSVNRVCKAAFGPWIFFTRSDYILSFDCMSRMMAASYPTLSTGGKPFVSGWCWQMAYDREAKNIDAHVDIEQYGWREEGMPALLQHPYAFRFHETDQDAGVWLTKKEYLEKVGWMNEGLISWGYQQSEFQRLLRNRVGVSCISVLDYLFAHQHHYADRNFDRASLEWQKHGRG